METNEETKYLNPTSKVENAEFEEQPISEPQSENTGWKKVAIGSAAGIHKKGIFRCLYHAD